MVAINSFAASSSPATTTPDRAARTAASREEAQHDALLVRRFTAGDDAAFVEIVARHREKMFSVAFAKLRNHADAEEIAQDAFIRAHGALARFRGDCTLATWLHRITVNLACNRYWYFFRRRRHVTQSLDRPCSDDNSATFADVFASAAPGPVQEATHREFSTLVAECMEKLRPQQREILTLRNVLNCSYDEIATTLRINSGTVKSRIARARESLRGLLATACPEFDRDALALNWFGSTRPVDGWQASCP